MSGNDVLLESQDSVMTMDDEGLFQIVYKSVIERGNYTPVDNTLDESTLHYLEIVKTWRLPDASRLHYLRTNRL